MINITDIEPDLDLIDTDFEDLVEDELFMLVKKLDKESKRFQRYKDKSSAYLLGYLNELKEYSLPQEIKDFSGFIEDLVGMYFLEEMFKARKAIGEETVDKIILDNSKNWVLTKTFPDSGELRDLKQTDKLTNSIHGFLIDIVQQDLDKAFEFDDFKKLTYFVHLFVPPFFVSPFGSEENFKLLDLYFVNKDNPNKKVRSDLLKMIDYEINRACKLQIIRKGIRFYEQDDKEIDESNYQLTLVNTDDDAFSMLSDILSSVIINIQAMIASPESSISFKVSETKTFQKLKEKHENLKAENLKLKENEQNLISENKRLNLQIFSFEISKEKRNDSLIERNEILSRQVSLLEKKYQSLMEDYNRQKEKLKELQTDETVNQIQEKSIIKEIDVNAKYVFVVDKAINLSKRLLDEFPNATIIDDTTGINVYSADLVISITKNIDHSTYYAVKNVCKASNIPFIHCLSKNIDLIKEVIWNYLNS